MATPCFSFFLPALYSCHICVENLGQLRVDSLVVDLDSVSSCAPRLVVSVDIFVMFLTPLAPTILPCSIIQQDSLSLA